MVRRIALVLLLIAILALIGIGYLQFSDESAYIAARDITRYEQIAEEDVTEVRFAKLRDRNLQHLITDKTGVVGKYAGRDIIAGEIFVDNETLLSELPPGRCLPEGYTAWLMPVEPVDTLGGRVTLNDYVDIVLIDPVRQRLTLLVQKIQPLDINEGSDQESYFIFAFTPEQVAVLDGIAAAENLKLGLLLNQEPNQLQALLQQYSMDYRQVPAGLFPLPTPIATPAAESVTVPAPRPGPVATATAD